MIRYGLKCEAGHAFDSWFQSGEAFAALQDKGRISCPICGTAKVGKELMAPAIRSARKAATPARGALSEPGSEIETALAALKKQIEENSEYVGLNFATEARRIHDGEAPERSIHGEAKPEEARRMIEDGLPVAPLPFVPGRKVN